MTVDRSRLPAVGPDLPFHLPRPVKQVRPDGLRVWSVEHRDMPVVAMLFLVPAGSGADPVDRPGLAALTADLLDEGAADRDALALHDALARCGARLEIDCTPDATFAGLLTLTRHARTALGLLADMVFRPRLAVEDFERLRALRRQRLAQVRDLPGATAERALLARLYGSHPYGHLPIGSDAALEAMTLDEVHAFHGRAYGTPGSTLILVGDLGHDEAMALADEVVTPVMAGPGFPEVPPVAEPEPDGARAVDVVARPGAPQSEVRVGRVGAPRATPEYHALVVANAVIGGQFTSRLNLNLRERRGYTYGVRSYFDFRRREGPFVVQTAVQTDATGPALREILNELGDLAGSRPVTPRELDLARQGLTRGYARNFETTEQIARAMAQMALHDLPDDSFDRFVEDIRAVDAEAVTRVARHYFTPDTMQCLLVGDPHHAVASLDAAGFASRVVEPDDRRAEPPSPDTTAPAPGSGLASARGQAHSGEGAARGA